MKGFSLNNYYEIPYIDRSYKVNNTPPVFKKNIDVISFFSGAGGLDIGSQLAGVKVISSSDFDFDSYKTLSSNNYFSQSEHFHKDIKDMIFIRFAKKISLKDIEKFSLSIKNQQFNGKKIIDGKGAERISNKIIYG